MSICKIANIAFVGALLSCAIALPCLAAEHPARGHPVADIFYSTYAADRCYPAEWSYGDITFVPALPAPDLLTAEEKYIIFGTKSSEYDSEHGLAPWRTIILKLVVDYYEQYSSIPPVLTPDVIRSISGFEQRTDDELREYLNPLSNQWPKLNATTLSPGDVYIRPLTEDDLSHFADLNPQWKMNWFDGLHWNPRTEKFDLKMPYIGAVMYLRIYGWNAVVHNTIGAVYKPAFE